MTLVAGYSESTLRTITWSIFWRFALLGLFILVGIAVLVQVVFFFLLFALYAAIDASRELMASITMGSLLFQSVATIGGSGWGLFLAFRRILRSQIGTLVQGSTLLIVSVATEKEPSNAN